MLPHLPLELKGSGFLNEIIVNEANFLVRICRTQSSETLNREIEAIWFDCEVRDPALKEKVLKYYPALLSQQSVKIAFSSIYEKTKDFCPCTTPEDPDHIVTIEVELTEITLLD